MSVTTRSASFILSYGTPLGLMTTSPSFLEMPLVLPNVKSTSPVRTNSRLASKTSRRRSGSSIVSAAWLRSVQPASMKVYAEELVDTASRLAGRVSAALVMATRTVGTRTTLCAFM